MNPNQARPFVRFETRPVLDLSKGRDEGGQPHYRDEDFIIIVPPASGGRTVVENTYKEWLAKTKTAPGVGRFDGPDNMPGVQDDRFPWLAEIQAAYAAWKQGTEIPLVGTPLKNWPVLTPSQLKNLTENGIRTIEELAQQSDSGVEFMGGITLRERARTWLESSKAGSLNELTMKLEDERMARQTAEQRTAALEEQVRELTAMVKGRQQAENQPE